MQTRSKVKWQIIDEVLWVRQCGWRIDHVLDLRPFAVPKSLFEVLDILFIIANLVVTTLV